MDDINNNSDFIPFYERLNYQHVTKQEMECGIGNEDLVGFENRWECNPQLKRKEAASTGTINTIIRFVQAIFGGIARFLFRPIRLLADIAALPAASLGPRDVAIERKQCVKNLASEEGDWKYKRIRLKVNGSLVDATVMCRPSTAKNGRWVLPSLGNGELYEQKLKSRDFKQFLTQLEGNAIFFNYPGVGSSQLNKNGTQREAMTKVYRAMLEYLENKNGLAKLVGAPVKEVIGYGHSIGGGVQGEALNSHDLKDDMKYLFIKSRTFSDVKSFVSSRNWLATPLVDAAEWNMSSVNSSKKLKVPEIIMQTANVFKAAELLDPSRYVDDGIISEKASLAKKLLEESDCPRDNKYFMGIPEKHNQPLGQATKDHLVAKINEMLSR